MDKSIILITFTLILMIGSMAQMINAQENDFMDRTKTAGAVFAGSLIQSKKSLKDLSQGKVQDSMNSGLGSMKTGLAAMDVMVKKDEWTF